MDNIRASIRKLPPKAAIKILKKVFSLPAPAARLIINEVTSARKSHQSWIHRVAKTKEQNYWSGCWIGENIHRLDSEALMKRVYDADLVLFFVHGGGFRIGSCVMYMDSTISWIKVLKEKYNLNTMIMSIDYRLAPEYRYPSPLEDVVKAYDYLTRKLAISPQKIITAGDSAGAALLLETLFITHDPHMFEILSEQDNAPITLYEMPRPAGMVLISPLVTDQTTSKSWIENEKYDFITQYTAQVIKKDYYGYIKPSSSSNSRGHHRNSSNSYNYNNGNIMMNTSSTASSMVSVNNTLTAAASASALDDDITMNETPQHHLLGIAQLNNEFAAFMPPKVLMYIGNLEVLRDDALELAEKAEISGVSWQTVIEENVHDWFCVREVVKDKSTLKRADDTFADYCYSCITVNDTNNSGTGASTVSDTAVCDTAVIATAVSATEVDMTTKTIDNDNNKVLSDTLTAFPTTPILTTMTTPAVATSTVTTPTVAKPAVTKPIVATETDSKDSTINHINSSNISFITKQQSFQTIMEPPEYADAIEDDDDDDSLSCDDDDAMSCSFLVEFRLSNLIMNNRIASTESDVTTATTNTTTATAAAPSIDCGQNEIPSSSKRSSDIVFV